jgi:hypothetical protein
MIAVRAEEVTVSALRFEGHCRDSLIKFAQGKRISSFGGHFNERDNGGKRSRRP